MKKSFEHRYQVGETLSLRDSSGNEVTRALVLEYDLKEDEVKAMARRSIWNRITRRNVISTQNHWHVCMQEPGTDNWMPAAIWQRGRPEGTFGAHFKIEHYYEDFFGIDNSLYSVGDLVSRVRPVADVVAQIVHIDSAQQSQ